MRVSTLECDSGYPKMREHGWPRRKCRVTLDGAEVRRCLTADEELGEVLQIVVDAEGWLVADGDRLATRWVYGAVVVEWL